MRTAIGCVLLIGLGWSGVLADTYTLTTTAEQEHAIHMEAQERGIPKSALVQEVLRAHIATFQEHQKGRRERALLRTFDQASEAEKQTIKTLLKLTD